jgi:CRISPR-associated protein Csb1
VLLDSVQSQANRMEIALLDAWEQKRIPLPVITVDFKEQNLAKSLRVTSLEAPHRIADALLRDSLLDGVLFRKSGVGQRIDNVDNHNATALFELNPTALVFGMWDSTGPIGGMGAKFARAMVSEIVGLNATLGVKTSSRIDPAQISRNAGPVYETEDDRFFTLEEAEAKKSGKKKEPAKHGKDGRPSEVNHGNIVPTIGDGGFTISKAVQTTVLSIPALRRLSFPLNGEAQSEVDCAARTVLATLALCAATLSREQGGVLRSRCHLFPTGSFIWDLLEKPGEEPEHFCISSDMAINLYEGALEEAKKIGLPWLDEELALTPSPDLVSLVRRSQELAAKSQIDGEDA